MRISTSTEAGAPAAAATYAIPSGRLKLGAKVPLVITPTSRVANKKLVTLARHAASVLGADSNQPPLESVALLRVERRGADELASELHERIEARLERRSCAIKLVAIERQPRFHSERVARTQPAGHHPGRCAGLEDRAEKRLGGSRGGEKLEAVLACVASPRDDASGARDFGLGDSEPPHRGERRAREPLQNRLGLWALYGDKPGLLAEIAEAGVLRAEFEQPFAVGGDIRRVDAEHVARVVEPVHDQVVDRAALRRAHQCVLGAAGFQPRRRIGHRTLEQLQGCAADKLELAHVAEVENPGARAHGEMFVDYPCVADRHLKAAERGHSGAELPMQLEQTGTSQRFHVRSDSIKGPDRQRGSAMHVHPQLIRRGFSRARDGTICAGRIATI